MPLFIIASLAAHTAIVAGIHFNIPVTAAKKPAKTVFIKTKIHKIPRIKKTSSVKIPPDYLKIPNLPVKTKRPLKAYNKPVITEKIEKSKTAVEMISPKDFAGSLPAYMAYYEKIRQKIKLSALRLYENSLTGKVNITFTLNNQGRLISMAINPQTTTAPEILRETAVKSINLSTPFPRFPKDLKEFKTLSFSLNIVFKKEN